MNNQTSKKLGVGMGVFGIALGSAEVLFPRTVARLIGVDPDGAAPVILRAMGLRELAASALIFAKPGSMVGRWARVAGDALDLGLLAAAAFSKDTGKLQLAGAAAAVLGAAVMDAMSVIPPGEAPRVAPVTSTPNGRKAAMTTQPTA